MVKQFYFWSYHTNVYLVIRYLLFICAFLLAEIHSAQSSTIKIVSDSNIAGIIKDSILNSKKNTPPEVLLSPIIEKLTMQNYLEASIDTMQVDSTTGHMLAYLHLGPQYDIDSLTLDSLSTAYINRLKLKEPKTIQEYLLLRKKIQTYYGNEGYPFCKINLNNLSYKKNSIYGQLQINTGPEILVDSIQLNGDVRIRQGYIENFLNFKKGEPYNHDKLLKINSQLNKLTFLKQEKTPDLSFYYNNAAINLYIEPKNASRFDLLFGVIPTSNIQGQQLFLSLDFTAEMRNKLSFGEYIYINFERLRPEQQNLELQFNYPYLLDLPFAIDTRLNIFRNGLNFSTLQSDLGIQYLINTSDYVKVSWNFESSNVIEIDTSRIIATKQLPIDLDFSQTGFGIEVFMDRLDYRFNPRSGYRIKARGIIGLKTIKLNPQILQLGASTDTFNYATLYDDVVLESPRYDISAELSYFQPLAARSAIGAHLRGAWRYADQGLLRNEKYQIGGNKILRGFDEAAFFTSYYAVSTLEYRLLLSDNSYFSVPFIDLGYFELEDGSSTYGIGLGGSLGFETKVGLFNFTVAVGRTRDIDFDLSRPKAHFGFISLF